MNKIKMIAAMFIAGILLTFVSCGDNGKSKKISAESASYHLTVCIHSFQEILLCLYSSWRQRHSMFLKCTSCPRAVVTAGVAFACLRHHIPLAWLDNPPTEEMIG